MRSYTRDPRTYELLTILSPDVPEEELPGALERLSGYVTGAGGTVDETLRDSPWGRRRLAYPIRFESRDVRDGYYTLFRLTLAPERVEEMERELKLNTQLMRYLVTVYTPVPLDPLAIEDAEFAAEDAAAAAYAAAQAEAARLSAAAEDDAAAAYAASQAAAASAAVAEAPAAAEAAAPATEPAGPAAESAAPDALATPAAGVPTAEAPAAVSPESTTAAAIDAGETGSAAPDAAPTADVAATTDSEER